MSLEKNKRGRNKRGNYADYREPPLVDLYSFDGSPITYLLSNAGLPILQQNVFIIVNYSAG